MKKLTYILPLAILFTACGSSRNAGGSSGASGTSGKSGSPTVKRTSHASPKFIDGIKVTPGEEGPGADGSPNTGAFSAPRRRGSSGATLNIENGTELQFKYAVLLNEEVENMTNLAMLQFIEEWYGTRYRYGGSTKKGIDCSAFVCTMTSEVFGKTLPRTSREQYERTQKIPVEYLQEGDLVFFNTRGGVSHVGIYLSNNKFVHASTSSGVVISDLNETYYKNRFVGAGRPE